MKTTLALGALSLVACSTTAPLPDRAPPQTRVPDAARTQDTGVPDTVAAEIPRRSEVALADHGVESPDADLSISCTPRPDACLTRRGLVTVTVDLTVPLPLVPAALTGDFPLAVPLSATATQQVSRFWTGG